MYLVGHAGIGYAMISVWPPVRRMSLPISAIILGTLLPDFIDKSLYYALGLFGGTRTIGHTLLFLILLFLFTGWWRSRWLLGLSLGVSTHLALDSLSDIIISHGQNFSQVSLLWPAYGRQFPATPFHDWKEQLAYAVNLVPLIGEFTGGLLAVSVWTFHRRQKLNPERTPAVPNDPCS